MSLINFILDIAGLLLWLSWRSIPLDPLARATPATLVGTVRRAEPRRTKRWHFLAGLGVLLLVRAFFYRQIGSAVDWTPRINLGVVVLAFRVDVFPTALLFSVLSFVRAWTILYFWLLALAFVNGHTARPDPILRMIHLHLGWVSRWPRPAQALLPGGFAALLWLATYPLLARAGVVHPVQAISHLLGQAAWVGVVLYLTLKHLLPVLLFLHLVGSYVYLGGSTLWDFVGATSRKILGLLKWVPLRLGRIDFAPLVAIVLILLLLHALPILVQRQLGEFKLTLWPP